MEYITNEGDFIDALNIPGRSRDERPRLDPDIGQGRLELIYGQMAEIMLQVSRPSFAEIGCIGKANDDEDRQKPASHVQHERTGPIKLSPARST